MGVGGNVHDNGNVKVNGKSIFHSFTLPLTFVSTFTFK